MIRRAAAGLALLFLLAGCAATPTLSPPASQPSPVGSPPSAGATVAIEASGRYLCESLAGCGAFVAVEPTDGIVTEALPEGWLPSEPYLLEQTQVGGEYGAVVYDVGAPTRSVAALPPGTYRVTAGSLWVDHTASTTEGPNAPNVFESVGRNGPCQMPLEVTDAMEHISIEATLREDAWCNLEVHGGWGSGWTPRWPGRSIARSSRMHAPPTSACCRRAPWSTRRGGRRRTIPGGGRKRWDPSDSTARPCGPSPTYRSDGID
jgi:hypothetical protein